MLDIDWSGWNEFNTNAMWLVIAFDPSDTNSIKLLVPYPLKKNNGEISKFPLIKKPIQNI